MRLSPRDRLRLWDAVAGMHPVDAAVRCLAVARPDLADPAGLPLGLRDAALLEVRRQLLGDRIIACAACPACDEPATVALSAAVLLAGMTTDADWTLDYGGRTLTVRSLTSRDAAKAASAASAEQARTALVRLALDDDDVIPDEAMAGAIAASLAEHDSGAEITLACTCASCGAAWREVLDVARFVSTEVAHHGLRLLTEIAQLARIFGWSEDAILALAEPRRRAYLALAVG
jgi:hypothetical protein